MNRSFSPETASADTIAAIASAPGPSLRGIIRISGPGVVDVLEQVLAAETSGQLRSSSRKSRRFSARVPVDAGALQLSVDVLYWPTHRSFTGETLAELHLVGSPPLLNEVLEQVLLCGARPAERGEFTLRAFLSGRIDLVQAEAVLGVIDAGNTSELRTALAQLAGGISDRMGILREELLLHLADLEAGLDFVEEDIEFVQRDELLRRLQSSRALINELIQQAAGRMVSSGRVKVVLAGLPNAGKSTLFNRLVGRQAALVSPIAGTTRDYLSAPVSHAGLAFELIDTAGWEPARDGIEQLAGELRSDQLERADLVLWCTALELGPEERQEDRELVRQCVAAGYSVLEIRTKADASVHSADVGNRAGESGQQIRISAEHGTGLVELLDEIVAKLSGGNTDSEMIAATSARCTESLLHALQGIERAIESIGLRAGDELIALELREVLEHLGRILGRVYTDDILDRIFSRFCIGK